ncbi:hypothetical protein [Halalkalicoccus sp. NIPERK01]|uniref:hypothetical protein n=1 Tax=Halalkalicoccus sp. NIPERK01 TaxID=3053469 RepID=UPI00256F311C|nr:hypothetical protein [Halalkalicoccus sp. NIPERK01]MDL5363779.1 hypothetical protein [Halalkalicoccus sp. NIPERK01]
MNRRKFIIASGSMVAVAGCTGDEGDGNGAPANGDEDEPTESAPGSSEEGNGTDESNGDDGGTAGDGDAGNESEDEERQDEETEEREEDEERGPHEFSGDGDEETEPFELAAGFTAVEFEHSGSGRFAVDLESEEGSGELLVNTSGAIDGSTARGIGSGTYSLSVEADGGWSLVVSQPSADAPEALPVSVDGDTPAYFGPLAFDGEVSVTGRHGGEGNFLVEALAENGDLIDQIVNEVGEVETSSSFGYDGAGWIVVGADGEWSLSIE